MILELCEARTIVHNFVDPEPGESAQWVRVEYVFADSDAAVCVEIATGSVRVDTSLRSGTGERIVLPTVAAAHRTKLKNQRHVKVGRPPFGEAVRRTRLGRQGFAEAVRRTRG